MTTEPASRPCISVVLPARNAADTIGAQLTALSAQVVDEPWEVVVADNGSTDSTAVLASSFVDSFPALIVVDASTAAGVNVARNAGIRRSSGDYVLFCDADDVVAPGWISALRRALSDADLVGGTLDVDTLNRSDALPLRTGSPLERLRVVGNFLPSAIGANMGFRRTVLDELGGFDESWSGGGDETECFWRAQLAGYRTSFAEDAVVAYRYREDPKEGVVQIRRYAAAQARLYREFRADGMPRSSLRAAIKGWLWLASRVFDLRFDDDRRAAWLRRWARRSGFLAGSIRHRVAYL